MEIKRDFYLEKLKARMGNGRAKVITGIRRCGKSYLLDTIFRSYLISTGVDEEHMISISLDTEETEHLRDRHVLADEIRRRMKDEGMYYIFLDEIQNVEGFELVINSLIRMKNADVYVTGSNSKFLSSDIITEFRGRGDRVHVQPLSFREIRPLYSSDEAAWEDYFIYGGLPSIYAERMNDDEKIDFLEYVTDIIYLKDVKDRNNLKEKGPLGYILDVLSSATASLTNPSKLARTFVSKGDNSITDKTVSRYISYLQDAYLIEKCQRYDIKGKEYINSPYKYYFTDVGVRNSRLNYRQLEENHVMENIIYNELRKRGFKVDVGIVIHSQKEGGLCQRRQYEVDFVANSGSRRYYIQSVLTLLDDDKLRQELRSLSLIRDSFRKIVITKDRIRPRRTEEGILIINLFDFLLDDSSMDQ